MANPSAKQETAKKTVISISASVAAAFGSTANDTNVDVTKVGYVTKASEGLPFRVVCLGPMTDKDGNVVKDQDGNVSFGYIADRPILESDSWYKSKDAFDKINKEGKFIEAGFGIANFPTSKHGNTGTDMLGMIHQNKKELGITVNLIHGELYYDSHLYFVEPNDGSHSYNDNSTHAATFPAWSVKHPII